MTAGLVFCNRTGATHSPGGNGTTSLVWRVRRTETCIVTVFYDDSIARISKEAKCRFEAKWVRARSTAWQRC